MGLRIVIEHNGKQFEPPIEEGVQIEWERTGSPGKLTFTTIKVSITEMSFVEGDRVCAYYDDNLIFVGYVFTKRRDKENHIEVTCYDQIRYLKNKFTYVFENKTASQIIQSMCTDFGLKIGVLSDTEYVIPSIAEENISALDIVLEVLEETMVNTGNMFVLYDDCGSLQIRNIDELRSDTLIMADTAENYDYKSSIDDETYNQVILYYKQDDQIVQTYTATAPDLIQQWGMLRYFEEVKNHTIGQNKANSLLKLYGKKTREFTVEGAFGDISIRGGSLIPVNLYLGDVIAENYMIVEKVTHIFDNDHYTMNLTLHASFEDSEPRIVSKTIGEIPVEIAESVNLGGDGESDVLSSTESTENVTQYVQSTVNIQFTGGFEYAQLVKVRYTRGGKEIRETLAVKNTRYSISCDKGATVTVNIIPLLGENRHGWMWLPYGGNWVLNSFGQCSVKTGISSNRPLLYIKFQSSFHCDWYGNGSIDGEAIPSYKKIWNMNHDPFGI